MMRDDLTAAMRKMTIQEVAQQCDQRGSRALAALVKLRARIARRPGRWRRRMNRVPPVQGEAEAG